MGNGAGTMGMSIVAFVAMWTAMMLPSVAPIAILCTRSILRQLRGNLLLAFIPFIAVPFFARLVSPSSTRPCQRRLQIAICLAWNKTLQSFATLP